MSLSISSATNASAASQISSILSSTNAPASSTDGVTPSDSSTVSQRGAMMSKLKDLATSDPAQFNEVAQKISDQLSTAAKGATGDKAKMLNNLATKFSNAASSGSFSDIAPQAVGGAGGARAAGGGKGHGHHHHHGGGGGGSSSQAGIDPTSSSSTSSTTDSTSSTSATQAAMAKAIASYRSNSSPPDLSQVDAIMSSALSGVTTS